MKKLNKPQKNLKQSKNQPVKKSYTKDKYCTKEQTFPQFLKFHKNKLKRENGKNKSKIHLVGAISSAIIYVSATATEHSF